MPGRALPFLGLLAAAAAAIGSAGGALGDEGVASTSPAGSARLAPEGPVVEPWKLSVRGWAEASATISPGTDDDVLAGRVFDGLSEGFRLRQAALVVEHVPIDACRFDVGGKIEVLWGSDATLIHAYGLLDDQTAEVNQFDLVEAYLSAHVPVGHGFTMKVGKCATPLGFEVIDAPGNALPSRSFLFGYAIPFTHTGVLAAYPLDARTTLTYGVFLGWDVWKDRNDAWTHVVGLSWTSPCGDDAWVANLIVGAERPANDRDLRTVVDVSWTHTWNPCWKTTVNADFGSEQGAAADGGTARWWGVAGYATATLSESLSATVRLEGFRDEDGTRLGVATTLSEVTLGVDWKPLRSFPALHVRPEVRWDHAFDEDFFDGGTERDQLSLVLDLLLTL